jgi:hypothetical protein
MATCVELQAILIPEAQLLANSDSTANINTFRLRCRFLSANKADAYHLNTQLVSVDMQLLPWKSKTAPAVVPFYDAAQDVVVLRVVKTVRKRGLTTKIPSKLTATTMGSNDSQATRSVNRRGLYSSEGGLYSSEGEAVETYPVEVQTESITLRHSGVRPRFVYCEELQQDIVEEIDFVDYRCDQNEEVEIQRRALSRTLEQRTEAPKSGIQECGLHACEGELPAVTRGTCKLEVFAPQKPEFALPTCRHQPPSPSGQSFSVLCSPMFAWGRETDRAVNSSGIPYEVVHSTTDTDYTRDDTTWMSGSMTIDEMPSMFDTVIDRVDSVLGDLDDADTLEGESVFGPEQYVERPIGLELSPQNELRVSQKKSLMDDDTTCCSEGTIDVEMTRRKSIFETILELFWGRGEDRDDDVNAGDDKGQLVSRPSGAMCDRSLDAFVGNVTAWDERDGSESILDGDDDSFYTLSFTPRSETNGK